MDSKRNLCGVCGAAFTRKNNLHRHEREKHKDSIMRVKCSVCSKSYIRKADLDKHLKTHNTKLQVCYKYDRNVQTHTEHLSTHDTTSPTSPAISAPSDTSITEASSTTSSADTITAPTSMEEASSSSNIISEDYDYQSALGGSCGSYKFHIPEGATDVQLALANLQQGMKTLIIQHIKTTGLKWYLGTGIRFIKIKNLEVETNASFCTTNIVTLEESSLDSDLEQQIIQLLHKIAQFQREGSDWVIGTIISIDLNFAQYQPLGKSRSSKPTQSRRKQRRYLK